MDGKYKKFNKLSENYTTFTENIQTEIEKIKPISFEEALLKNYTEYVINRTTLDIIKKQLPESLQILHKYIKHYYNEIQDYLISIPIDNIQIWTKIPNVNSFYFQILINYKLFKYIYLTFLFLFFLFFF